MAAPFFGLHATGVVFLLQEQDLALARIALRARLFASLTPSGPLFVRCYVPAGEEKSSALPCDRSGCGNGGSAAKTDLAQIDLHRNAYRETGISPGFLSWGSLFPLDDTVLTLARARGSPCKQGSYRKGRMMLSRRLGIKKRPPRGPFFTLTEG